MASKNTPDKYWTKERCYEEARKYSSKQELRENCSSAYTIAWRNKWLDDYTWFNKKRNAPNKKWTKETTEKEARKYKTRDEFRRNSSGAYTAALNNNWMSEYTWFGPTRHPNGYWNSKEHCQKEALKYNTRTEFKQNNSAAYRSACEHKWIDDITKHMKSDYSDYSFENSIYYVIYVYEDIDNKVAYVGLTNCIKRRHYEHQQQDNRNNLYDSVMKYFISIDKELPEPKVIYENLTAVEASEKEKEVYYKMKADGWNMINDESALGIIGSTRRKWTKRRCFKEARKYNSKVEFKKNCQNAYDAAIKFGWIDDYTWFERPEHWNKKWTRKSCCDAAKECENSTEMLEKYPGAYSAASKNHWLDDYTWFINPTLIWTKERCYEEAKKYEIYSDFREKSPQAYQSARRNHWLNDYVWLDKVEQYWTEYRTKEEAKKYKTKKEFREAVPSAYYAAHRNGWLKEYDWFKRPSQIKKWTYEACYKEAKKYKTIKDFRANSNSCYVTASSKKWLKDYTWLKRKHK